MSEEEFESQENPPEEAQNPENQDGGEALEDVWGEALAEQAGSSQAEDAPDVTRADYETLEQEGGQALQAQEGSDDNVNLDVILDIPVTISMEIGRTRLSIRNLLQLNQGSVVELDRLAGEPMDVLVNGTLIAHGEVVVVNDKFGIRLTDVISPAERVRRLR
ncbi:flagellar motor switch protein FliN/FliY [Methylomarinovum tepidoasis]|uniref:Flagellar motor switch protein FliN n=1 Tax=Methylomarinovum tepidoasis TaxID=2840183 RepID=A0AAU9CWY4_9GAMM|nr:flagellar motor switch protein FliN [Methylomarinovum sp. IN45]BCX89200.1 flagellar motor switch protein FliN/FliY [Methylomarinovum sp. IN45]